MEMDFETYRVENMLRTKLLAPAIAAAAVGGYAVYNHQDQSGAATTNVISEGETKAAIELANQPAAPPVFQAVADYREFLRFDVYPNWVKDRWLRVSTAPYEPGLHGMRVAVVTGVGPTDLSGSLTYYFDNTHRVQKIQFVGTTDDASRLVALLTQHFDFKTQRSLNAGFYMAGSKRKPSGVLKLGHPVAIHTRRSGQVMVFLEMLAPRSEFRLSEKAYFAIGNEMRVNQ